jgi:hypothetical protein
VTIKLPRQSFLALAVMAAAALASGCGPDCVSVCVELNKCPGGKPADCKKQCADAEVLNRAAVCERPFAALQACVARHPDRCAKDLCPAENKAYAECVVPHCSRNPTAPECH